MIITLNPDSKTVAPQDGTCTLFPEVNSVSEYFQSPSRDPSNRMATLAKTRPIFHDDWLIRFRENRPCRTLKHLAAMLSGTARQEIFPQ